MSFSGFGDTSSSFSLSRSSGSLVFVSVLSFVPWIHRLGLLMVLQNSSTWLSCLFVYIFLIDAWIFILSTSSSIPDDLAAAAASHCVFSKISSECRLPYWIFSAFIFHPYFWFSHLFYWLFTLCCWLSSSDPDWIHLLVDILFQIFDYFFQKILKSLSGSSPVSIS